MSRQFAHVLLAEIGTTSPTEFRLFKAGINDTTKGPVLFDRQAAASVMAEYRKHGTDIMLDLEHDSLSPEMRVMRNDASDAMGWFKLELRGGELWAVDIRFTAPGAQRLANRTQRYTSPAFTVDEDGRPIRLVNVALCAMPATFGALPLIAASQTGVLSSRLPVRSIDKIRKLARSRGTTTSKLIKCLVDALPTGVDPDTSDEMLQAVLEALGLPPESDIETVKAAVLALFDNAAGAHDGGDAGGNVPELADPSALLSELGAFFRSLPAIEATMLAAAGAKPKPARTRPTTLTAEEIGAIRRATGVEPSVLLDRMAARRAKPRKKN